MSNKKFQAIIKELFIRCKKINISLVLITQSYFSVPKDVRLNSTHYLIVKINNKEEQRFCEDLQRMHKRTVFFFDNRYYATSKSSSMI